MKKKISAKQITTVAAVLLAVAVQAIPGGVTMVFMGPPGGENFYEYHSFFEFRYLMSWTMILPPATVLSIAAVITAVWYGITKADLPRIITAALLGAAGTILLLYTGLYIAFHPIGRLSWQMPAVTVLLLAGFVAALIPEGKKPKERIPG